MQFKSLFDHLQIQLFHFQRINYNQLFFIIWAEHLASLFLSLFSLGHMHPYMVFGLSGPVKARGEEGS